jgi:FixJ family two-component response regulator
VDCVQKPFSEHTLLDRIHQAIEQDAKGRTLLGRQDEIVERIASLTPRERPVMELVIDGMANKVIAIDLGAS